jgi:hypothetical protein
MHPHQLYLKTANASTKITRKSLDLAKQQQQVSNGVDYFIFQQHWILADPNIGFSIA